jgi:hypothetical protein
MAKQSECVYSLLEYLKFLTVYLLFLFTWYIQHNWLPFFILCLPFLGLLNLGKQMGL